MCRSLITNRGQLLIKIRSLLFIDWSLHNYWKTCGRYHGPWEPTVKRVSMRHSIPNGRDKVSSFVTHGCRLGSGVWSEILPQVRKDYWEEDSQPTCEGKVSTQDETGPKQDKSHCSGRRRKKYILNQKPRRSRESWLTNRVLTGVNRGTVEVRRSGYGVGLKKRSVENKTQGGSYCRTSKNKSKPSETTP